MTLGFNPRGTSKPYEERHTRLNTAGENIEMQQRHLDLPDIPGTSYAETNLGGTHSTEEIERRLNSLRNSNTDLLDMTEIQLQNIILSEADKQKEIQKVKALNKVYFPEATDEDIDKLNIKFSDKNKLNQIVAIGPHGGDSETKIARDDGKGLLKEFMKKSFVKHLLGPTAEEVKEKLIAKAREEEKTRKEAEKTLKQAKDDAAKIVQQEQDLREIRRKIVEVQDEQNEIDKKHGTGLEMENKKREQDLLEKKLQKDYEEEK